MHSSYNMSGAAEHYSYMEKACVVSLNVGLPAVAVRGKQWNTHHKVLLRKFIKALTFSKDVIGLLVSGVGSVTDPYDIEERHKIDELVQEAFQLAGEQTGAPEHNELRAFWATGIAAETVMYFKSYVEVTMLETIILPESWRRVEVALIQGATEHDDEVSLLIYNTHQPSSSRHKFTLSKKTAFCKHVLRHAITEHSARENNVGFVFGGDANCMRTPWSTAIMETTSHRLHFKEPWFIFANEDIVAHPTKAKHGDLAVVMGIENLCGRQFDLRLQSRKKAHDVMLIGWSWTGKIPHKPQALPPRKRARHAGASEEEQAEKTSEEELVEETSETKL